MVHCEFIISNNLGIVCARVLLQQEPAKLDDPLASIEFPLDVLRIICDFLPPSALASMRLSSRLLLFASAHLLKRFDLQNGNLLCIYPECCRHAHPVYSHLSDLSLTLLDTDSWRQCGSLCNTGTVNQSVLDADMSELDLNTVDSYEDMAAASACAILRCLKPILPALVSLCLCASLPNLKQLTAALRSDGVRFDSLSHIKLDSYSTEWPQPVVALSTAILQDLSLLPSLTSLDLELDTSCSNTAISQHLPRLVSLSSSVPCVSSKGRCFTDILTLPLLQSLAWSSCMTAAAEVSSGCSSLTSLDLTACIKYDTTPMRFSFAVCLLSSLRRLLLPSDIGDTRSWDPAIATLLAALPHLDTLSASGFTFRTNYLGQLVPSQLTQLTQLSCKDIHLGRGYDEIADDHAVFFLSQCLSALKVLKLQPSEYTVSLPELAPGLTSLHLSDNLTTMTYPWDLFYDYRTEGSGALPNLTCLTMSNMDLANHACGAACLNIKRLKLWVTPYDRWACLDVEKQCRIRKQK